MMNKRSTLSSPGNPVNLEILSVFPVRRRALPYGRASDNSNLSLAGEVLRKVAAACRVAAKASRPHRLRI